MLKDDERQIIIDRVRNGYDTPLLKRIRERDIAACRRYRDASLEMAAMGGYPSNATEFELEDYAETQSVGTIPYATINFLYKTSAMLFNKPELHVDMDELPVPEMGDIPEKFLLEIYDKSEWKSLLKRALLKRYLSGMGCVAVIWDEEEGVCWEHVSIRDIVVDPNVIDFNRLKWGARRVLVPKEEALEKYPDLAPLVGKEDYKSESFLAKPRKYNNYELWQYWDEDFEVTIYDNEIIDVSENYYKRVPLHFLRGEIDPNSPADLGDFDIMYGMHVKLTELVDLVMAQATHGGAITVYDIQAVGPTISAQLQEGVPSQWIGLESGLTEEAIHRVPSEPENPTTMRGMQLLMSMIDAVQCVTDHNRGEIVNAAPTATEAALTAQLSGARANEQKIDFERFLSKLFMETVKQFIRFTNATHPEQAILMAALGAVRTITVIEDSMTYKDPNWVLNTSQMAWQAALQALQAGLPVNLKYFFEKLVRATGERNTDRCFMPPAPMGMPGQPAPMGQPSPPMSSPMQASPVGAGQSQPGGAPALPGGGRRMMGGVQQ